MPEPITAFWNFLDTCTAKTAIELMAEVQARYGEGIIAFDPYSDPDQKKPHVGKIEIDTDRIEPNQWPGFVNIYFRVDTNLVKTKGWERYGRQLQP